MIVVITNVLFVCSVIGERIERGRRRGSGPHAGVTVWCWCGGGHGAGRRRCGRRWSHRAAPRAQPLFGEPTAYGLTQGASL